MLFYIFAPILFFLCLNVLTVRLAKKPFGFAMPLTILLCGFALYLSQMVFSTFWVALFAMYFLAASGIVLAILDRKNETFRKNYFSNGFFAFLLIYLLFLVVDYKYQIGGWDEASHWGKMVKEMLRLDSFYCVNESNLLAHKDYPPFTGLLEMLWCNLAGGHSDAAMLMGLHMAEYSFVALPLSEQFSETGKKWKRICSLCALIFFLSLLFFVFDASTFNTIYTDLYIAILFGFATLIAADERIRRGRFGYLAILLAQCALVLSKQMGIAFVLLTWLFYTILEIFAFAKEKQHAAAVTDQEPVAKPGRQRRGVGLAVRSLGLLAAPAASYLSWKLILIANGITGGQFSASKISLQNLLPIFLGRGSDVKNTVFRNYLKALFYGDLYHGPIGMTYIALAIAALLILGILFYCFRSALQKGEIVAYVATLVCGSVGYAFTMLVLYIFCYSDGEATELASFSRYMGTYLLASLLLLVIFAAVMLRREGKLVWNPRAMCMILLVTLLLTDTTRLANFIPKVFFRNGGQDYLLMAREIQANTEEGAKIILASSSNVALTFYVNYFLDDGRAIDVDYINDNISLWEVSDRDRWERLLTSVREGEYLYVAETSDALEEALGECLSDGSFSSMTLYQAHEKDGKTVLEKAE